MPAAANPVPASTTPPGTERRVGIGQGDYLDLFLQADDFGPAMKRVQDSRLQGPDPVDVWFPKYQGILTGMSVWLGSTADPIWRVVDYSGPWKSDRGLSCAPS